MNTCQICKNKPARRKYCPECAVKVIKRNGNNYKAKVNKSTRKRNRKVRFAIDASECVGNMANAIYD